jgi:hypothetical protein
VIDNNNFVDNWFSKPISGKRLPHAASTSGAWYENL